MMGLNYGSILSRKSIGCSKRWERGLLQQLPPQGLIGGRIWSGPVFQHGYPAVGRFWQGYPRAVRPLKAWSKRY